MKGGVRALILFSDPRPGQHCDQLRRSRQQLAIGRRQRVERRGETGHPPAASFLEQLAAPGRGADPEHPAVLRVAHPLDQAFPLEPAHQPGHRGWLQLLGRGERRHGKGPREHHHRERRQPGPREPGGAVLHPHRAEQMNGGGMQPVRRGNGGRSGRSLTAAEADHRIS
jgi:hypothetical protein